VVRIQKSGSVAAAVIPPLQRWPIIIVGLVVAAILVGGRCPPQAGPVLVFLLVQDLVTVFNRRQPRFDVVKL